jgi:putative endonuclease
LVATYEKRKALIFFIHLLFTMAKHNDTGKIGEALAVTWFTEKGYTILYTNWRHKNLEVDIIASKNKMLYFIEVKAVTTLQYGYPEEKITEKKIKNLINASEEYLYQNPQWQRIQFDVLSITMLPNAVVEYFLIEDVYL